MLTMGNAKGSDHCYIKNIGTMPDWTEYVGAFDIKPGWSKTHLKGCIGGIICFHSGLMDENTSYIHQYLMRKVGLAFHKCEVPNKAILTKHRTLSQVTS